MIRNIEKHKLPQQMAFVVKTSIIVEWVAREHITTDIFLTYSGMTGDYIFSASFGLPSSGIPFEHLLITAGMYNIKWLRPFEKALSQRLYLR